MHETEEWANNSAARAVLFALIMRAQQFKINEREMETEGGRQRGLRYKHILDLLTLHTEKYDAHRESCVL